MNGDEIGVMDSWLSGKCRVIDQHELLGPSLGSNRIGQS